MPDNQYIAPFYIKINGSDVPAALMDVVQEIEVDQSLFMPWMFQIKIHDDALEWVDHDLFKVGNEVEIEAGTVEDVNAHVRLFKGEITALEADFGEQMLTELVVRGYDRSHRLHREQKTRAFANAKVSDIARRVIAGAGLTADIETTTTVYDHIYQDNQTDFDFLRALATRVGYLFRIENGKLTFNKPATTAGSLSLTYGSDLLSFRPRMTTASQVNEAQVRGWDAEQKRPWVGSARVRPVARDLQQGAQAFGAGKAILHSFVVSQADGEEVARGIASEAARAGMQADGIAVGNPDLRPGKTLTIEGIGTRFAIPYYVTKARHIYRSDDIYKTEFSITGHHTDTLVNLVTSGATARTRNGSNAGGLTVTVGVVTNTDDPQKWGRVKVKFPMLDENVESSWARVLTPSAGPESGFFTLPEVNDEVLVLFANGDPNYPFVVGSLWNGKDKIPPEASAAGAGELPHKRVFRSRNGHVVLLDDTAEKLVRIKTAGGHQVLLDDANKVVKVTTAAGQLVALDDQRGSVEVKSSDGHAVALERGRVTLDSKGSVEIKSATTLKLQANATIDIQASGPVNIKGAIVNLN